ncbi:MAG: biosynthetic-type acetolactate synthase large subunit [Gemmatimonadaceae bacterium]
MSIPDSSDSSTPSDRQRTGAQIICESLRRESVRVVFGIPGGAIMPLYHALWEYRDALRHVLCRHEQGAGHAAEGWARATGSVGVCLATSGPGATNLVTPIANAWMDSTPLVAITGQVSSALLGTDAFQEIDITGITVPITKHNYLVTSAVDLPRVLREAFHVARSGRPGPVLVDITKDAQLERITPEWAAPILRPGSSVSSSPAQDAIQRIAEILTTAERPLMLVGNGIIESGASNALRVFAEHSGIPVVATLLGLGVMPEHHPLWLGMPGMHGWVHVNRAIQRCDVLLNIGSRFDDRVTGKVASFAPRARIIHIDIDAAEISKLVPVEVGVVADAGAALHALTGALPNEDPNRFQTWRDEIAALRDQHRPRQTYVRVDSKSPLAPHDIFDGFNDAFENRSDWRVVTDVGQHQMWAAQLIHWQRPRAHLTSGGAGTMGFALPAAIGAAIANPHETIWVVCGDGGFQMTSGELATIRQERLTNLKVAIVNNGYLGMVRQWQELFEGRRYSGTPLTGPNFELLAEAHGHRGFTVRERANVRGAIQAAWSHEGCAVIDFHVEREANVFPIVPTGNAIGDMISESAARPSPHMVS